MAKTLKLSREISKAEIEMLQAMTLSPTIDENTKARAKAILSFIESEDLKKAAKESSLSGGTVRKYLRAFDIGGWQALISIQSPRGGDFLARYDQGYWAERLATVYLDSSQECRAIPYGTSRSEPFTDVAAFRKYALSEIMLQAWSAGQRWKRPDLLLLPRAVLIEEAGNDVWTPDLMHWDNDTCAPYLAKSTAAVEVETSLWQVARATVPLSFTVKLEDLEALRYWVRKYKIPLYIIQVFYDQAYALPFSSLEFLIGRDAPRDRKVEAEVNRFTEKPTYMVPLTEGTKLGDIPEPDVEGRVFKADNGRVTVYGRLTGSRIEVGSQEVLEALATGQLGQEG